MHFKLVVSKYKHHISFPSNFTFYKWCVTKVAHCIEANSEDPEQTAPIGAAGLPRSGKKFWKMKKIPGQGKVREFHFQSGKFRKMKKSQGKVWEFQNF